MRTKKIAYCAIFVALTAILSQIAIPIGPIPINLALISVYMSGIMLGGFYGALSMVIYILLGVIGIPVFVGFQGGAGAIVGATGGFIVAYIFVSLFVGIGAKFFKDKMIFILLCLIISTALLYLLGALWYMQFSAASFYQAIIICVVPFIFGDIIKIFISVVLGLKLKKLLKLNNIN